MLSGSYSFYAGGPAFADEIAATLTEGITALITLSARTRAACEAALQVDANVVWQEWQAMSRARTLAIDLVEQGRLLRSLDLVLDLLHGRAALAARPWSKATPPCRPWHPK